MHDDNTGPDDFGSYGDAYLRHERRLEKVAEELVTLVRLHGGSWDLGRLNTAINQVLAKVSVFEQRQVLIMAALQAPQGSPEAIPWLVAALRKNKKRDEVFEIRSVALMHREAAPQQWDAAWRQATGSVPRWLKSPKNRYSPLRMAAWLELLRQGPGEWIRTLRIYTIQYRYRWSKGDRSPWW
ncbi:hypothetical protein [Nocardia sp. NPDC056100]|uniref:hypothetical protein n=1 Tax=Nocardia sp. NPDC056100 TaxID=3345712 RepID=UPI0035D67D0C